MPKKKNAATPDRCSPKDLKRATEMLWELLDGEASPFIALRNRSIVMCELMNQLEENSSGVEFEAFNAHAHDLEASRLAVEEALDEAYRLLANDPRTSSGGAR